MEVTQSCPALCDPIDYIVYGILQVRILEWIAVPSPGDLANPEIEPRYPTLQADSLPANLPGKPFFFLLNYCHAVSYACVSFKYLQEKDEELSVKFSYYLTEFLDPYF